MTNENGPQQQPCREQALNFGCLAQKELAVAVTFYKKDDSKGIAYNIGQPVGKMSYFSRKMYQQRKEVE